MAYKTLNLANAFIDLGVKNELLHLNSMKLQRLLFLTQVYSLQLYRSAIIDDSFVKWEYGPVIPSLYHRIKDQKAAILKDYIYELRFKEGFQKEIFYSTISRDDKVSWDIISYMASQYKEHKGSDLSNLILKNKAWSELGESSSVITYAQMKSFYEVKEHLKIISF